MIQIRNASKADLKIIIRFIKQLADYEKLSHEVNIDEVLLENNLFGETPFAEVLIAEYDGEEAGFALFFHNFSTFLGKPGIYLEDLFVDPKFRGYGIGRALLAKLAQITKTRNCGRLEWSVLDWNKPAIDFYLKLGAKPMNEWTVYRITGEELNNLAKT